MLFHALIFKYHSILTISFEISYTFRNGPLYMYICLRCKANDEYTDACKASQKNSYRVRASCPLNHLAINSLGRLLRDLSSTVRSPHVWLIYHWMDWKGTSIELSSQPTLQEGEILLSRKDPLVANGWTFCVTSRAESIYAQCILIYMTTTREIPLYQCFKKRISVSLRVGNKK